MGTPSDWLSRVTVPDIYPRQFDPYRPAMNFEQPIVAQGDVPPTSTGLGSSLSIQLTQPGMRPTVTQRAVNFGLPINGATSTPIVSSRLEVDAFIVDVPSASLVSAWVGFGSQITVGTGVEVAPGSPQFFGASNNREQWELQRVFEYMAALMALQMQADALPVYKAPRVVLNAADWWIISNTAPAQTIGIMLFFIPEQQ